MNLRVEESQKAIEDLKANARVACSKDVGSQEHEPACGRDVEWGTHPNGVASNEITLKRAEVGFVDADVG